MLSYRLKLRTQVAALLSATVFILSCNKDLPVAVPIQPTPPTGSTIMALLDAPSFSLMKAAVTRAGLNTALNTPTNVYTLFAPDDAAFAISGVNLAMINGMPLASLQALISYHLIGGQKYTASAISDKYPNMYLQSMLMLSAPSTSLPPGYRMPLGISKRGTAAWANQMPIKQADMAASNGVMHVVAALLNPPQLVLAQTIMGTDPEYAYLRNAIKRADQGPPTGAPALTPLLANAAANFTFFAPTNQAFQNLLAGMGLPVDTLTLAALPTTTVWGIVAFHIQSVRAFAPNLDNTSRASIMGVAQQFNVTSSAVQVRGPGNVVPTPGGPVNYYANVTTSNLNHVNGVIHRVDAVLLPQ